jgi:hypothetical protein
MLPVLLTAFKEYCYYCRVPEHQGSEPHQDKNTTAGRPQHIVARWRSGVLMTCTLLTCTVVLWGMHQRTDSKPKGLDMIKSMWPIESTAWLKQLPSEMRPQPNIYHTYTFGNYLLYWLRDYKVFGDTRETPFKHLESQYYGAYASPDILRYLLDVYNVSTIITVIPGTELLADGTYRNIIQEYTPPDKWGLVFFDNTSIISVRRIAEHTHLLNNFEFKILNPSLPHDHYYTHRAGNVTNDVLLGREVKLCRKIVPQNVYCKLAFSSWFRRHRSPQAISKTLQPMIQRLAEQIPYHREVAREREIVELCAMYGNVNGCLFKSIIQHS